MADVDYTIVESYTRAIERIYRKGNIFASVLAACALTKTDDLGQFTASSVEAPMSAIMNATYKVPVFSFHLNQMSSLEPGSVLRKTGARRKFQYNFAEPAMQPYIVMKSLDEGIITKKIFERFYVKRQKALPI